VVLVVTVVLLAGGSSGNGKGSGRPRTVVAAFYPLAYAAEQIGGPSVQVENLTPPGAEPHDLEVSSDDVRALESADLVLLMGHGFQPQLEQAADQAGGRTVRLLDTPELRLAGSPDQSGGDIDPHVWLDPVRYEAIVERIADALGRPAAARPLVARLNRLNRGFRAGLADCARHEIVTGHEAFAYLAQRYGLRQVSILGLSPEAEPTPGKLSSVIDEIRTSGATTVFTETLLSPKLAETVARETGATTAVLDPIEGLTPEEQAAGDDYFSLMRQNLAKLRAALGCR
jgi:zinc transport system substrate-binding protein